MRTEKVGFIEFGQRNDAGSSYIGGHNDMWCNVMRCTRRSYVNYVFYHHYLTLAVRSVAGSPYSFDCGSEQSFFM